MSKFSKWFFLSFTTIYCLLSSWFWADVVNFDTTRVSARFSARKRSFSCLYLFNSYSINYQFIGYCVRITTFIIFGKRFPYFFQNQKNIVILCIKLQFEKKEEKKKEKKKKNELQWSLICHYLCIKIKQMTWIWVIYVTCCNNSQKISVL